MVQPVSYSCYKPECSHLSFRSFTRYVCHLRNNHSHEPNFKVNCPVKGCFRCYSVISSLNSHMRRKHKYDIEAEVDVRIHGDNLDTNDEVLQLVNDDPCTGEIIPLDGNENKENGDSDHISVRELALYALKTQELNQLSDSATDKVLESTSHLLQQNEENLKKRVRRCLQNSAVNVKDIEGLEDVLNIEIMVIDRMLIRFR